MLDERKRERRREIKDIAYTVLAERGFASTSMLEIAKRARASNETLYQWYGDKLGLFAAMIEGNRDAAGQLLEASIAGADLADDLLAFGSALLGSILSDRAILLNRAAAADASGALGRVLTRHGRDSVMALLLQRLEGEPLAPGFSDHGDMAECFIALLVGERQIRRVLGALDEPDEATCKVWAAGAVRRFLSLLASPGRA